MATSKKNLVKKAVTKTSLPKRQPKSHLKFLLVILMIAIAGFIAIMVSARVSQQASIAPNAPQSQPFAREIEKTPTPNPNKCKTGDKKCVGSNVVVCGSTGKWEYSLSCIGSLKCSGGRCVKK